MAENKAPSFFHLYLDYDEQFRMLSDTQAGMLIKALFPMQMTVRSLILTT